MIKIRKATPKDFSRMTEIMIAAFSFPPYNDHWTKKSALETIKKDYKEGIIYLATEDNKIQGFISVISEPYHKPIIMIENLVVAIEAQNKGIGKILVKEIEEHYKKKNYYMISLITNKKASAFKFYKKLGYKESKSNVTLTKRLN